MNVMLNGGRPPACIDCGHTGSTMCAEYTFDDNGFPVSFNTTTLVSHDVTICPFVSNYVNRHEYPSHSSQHSEAWQLRFTLC